MLIEANLRREAIAPRVRDEPLRVSADTPVERVLAAMRDARASYAFVQEGPTLVGLFTERDVLEHVAGRPESLPQSVGRFMRPVPALLSPDATVAEAVHAIERAGVRHVPIGAPGEEPLGVVDRVDIVHYLVEHYERDVHTLHPTPDRAHDAREGG